MRRVILVLTAIAAAFAGPAYASPQSRWQTRLLLAANDREHPVSIRDGQGAVLGGVMSWGASVSLEPAVVPVCASAKSFRAQALRVATDRKYLASVCQSARDGIVYTVPRSQYWFSREKCLPRTYAYVSLRVEESGEVRCYGYDKRPDDDPGTLLQ